MIVIEKNIQMPERAHGRAGNGKSKYPWKKMEVGDSFLISHLKQGAVSSACRMAEKRTGMQFTTSQVEGGVRVWRMA